MRITIIGASHLGLTIAKLLANESYDVILVDANEAILESIRDELDILTIHADGTSPSLMRDPDIRKSDFLVAATASDESNIIASILAKQNGIPHTIARIREMKYLSEPASYLHENFDIDLILSPELITAREIFQLLRTPHALNIEDFAGGRVRLLETKLSSASPLVHIPLKSLSLPPSLLIAMVQRPRHPDPARQRLPAPDGQCIFPRNAGIDFRNGIPREPSRAAKGEESRHHRRGPHWSGARPHAGGAGDLCQSHRQGQDAL